jgi:hypothetical protein
MSSKNRPMTRQSVISRKLHTHQCVSDWISDLETMGLFYHLDDAPETIITYRTGKRLFTDSEAQIMTDQVCEAEIIAGSHNKLWDLVPLDCYLGNVESRSNTDE